MKMKSTCSLALLAATSALLVTSASLRASDTDSRIESSAAKSYVFKTCLLYTSPFSLAGSCQCHLDWRRLGQPPSRHRHCGSIASLGDDSMRTPLVILLLLLLIPSAVSYTHLSLTFACASCMICDTPEDNCGTGALTAAGCAVVVAVEFCARVFDADKARPATAKTASIFCQ